MKINILLIGEFYSENLGDGVLCSIVKKILQETYSCKIDCLDISAKEDYGKEIKLSVYNRIIRKGYMLLSKFKLLTIEEKINVLGKYNYYKRFNKNYDLIVFCGGQMFMNFFVGNLGFLLDFYNKKQIPVIFHACGAKNIINKDIIKKLQKVLSYDNIKSISVRDNLNLVNNIYLKYSSIKAVETFDTALLTKEYFSHCINEKSRICVGLGVISLSNSEFSEKLFINFWINIIDELNRRNIKWRMFCNGALSDYYLAKKILKIKGLKEEIFLQERPKTPEELISNISEFKSLISFRLHSHIIASACDIPSIAIIWDKKVEEFFKKINLEKRCKTINDSAQDIVDCLELVEKEGIDNNIIKKQGYLSKKSLLDNINRIIKS